MKLQWNKVTWYSKTIALAIFIILPFIFFCFGALYGATLQHNIDTSNSQRVPIQTSRP